VASIRMWHSYCPIWVKFGIRGLNASMLSVYEFLDRRLKKDRTFRTGMN
jgi:hypothetical protein